jgi:hypothetical protein
MMLTMRWMLPLAALVVLLGGAAQAYLVRKPLTLDQLTAGADIVFKGTVVSSRPASGTSLAPIRGFQDRETRFRIVSVVKGSAGEDTLTVRHYDMAPGNGRAPYEPELYHFELGRTYLVFAKQTADGFQLSTQPSTKQSEGAILCADASPVSATDIHKIVWSELYRMLHSRLSSDVTYAIAQLDLMSGAGGFRDYDATTDFSRRDVLDSIHTFLANSDPAIAQAAIGVVGSHNPYMVPGEPEFWLATVGSADLPDSTKLDPTVRNVGGEMYWRELASVAEHNRDAATRALAILALGLVRQPAIEKDLEAWLIDQSSQVRAAATILLADYPSIATHERLALSADEKDPNVRASAALAIGYGQYVSGADLLSTLLHDADANVRKTAAMSLWSFSARYRAIGAVLKANIADPLFGPTFLNALAAWNTPQYLDALVHELDTQVPPIISWSGWAPQTVARDILFRYLQAQPVDEVVSGKLDRYLDALEQTGMFLSGDQTEIYAFYLERGATKRAQRFRQKIGGSALAEIESSPWTFEKHWPTGSEPDPVKYTLEVTSKHLVVGGVPEFRVTVSNVSSRALQHTIRPGTLGFALRIEGAGGATTAPVWWFQKDVPKPYVIDLAPGEERYLFGGPTTFVSADRATFPEEGFYNVRYCDDWPIGGNPRSVCSNEIQIQVSAH